MLASLPPIRNARSVFLFFAATVSLSTARGGAYRDLMSLYKISRNCLFDSNNLLRLFYLHILRGNIRAIGTHGQILSHPSYAGMKWQDMYYHSFVFS
jgi:hypothetical protein